MNVTKIVPLSVTQINNQSDYLLKSNLLNLCVKGEISSLKNYPSGFTYITLKDEHSELRCVAYPNVQNIDELSIGKIVSFQGNVSIYVPKGTYQFIVKEFKQDNYGLIWKKYLELKDKLNKEGLFNQSNKKNITNYPFKIAIISSDQGTVIHDMLNILKLKAKHIKILIVNTKVQGIKAPEDIIKSIKLLNEEDNLDVIIIARGGGSFEDLDCFNNENLARAIFNSKVPIISAIGHQTDYTIADYVSDYRASTPTAAAQTIIYNFDKVKEQLLHTKKLIIHTLEQRIELIKSQNVFYQSKLSLNHLAEKVNSLKNQKNNYQKLISLSINNRISIYSDRLFSIRKSLKNNEVSNILKKGYALVYDEHGGLINNTKKINLNQNINIKFLKGKIGAKIIEKK